MESQVNKFKTTPQIWSYNKPREQIQNIAFDMPSAQRRVLRSKTTALNGSARKRNKSAACKSLNFQ